jgi:hypothetical protein
MKLKKKLRKIKEITMHPIARRDNLVIQETAEEELLVYDLRVSKAFCLNETSALVWQACDGNNSVAEISRKLADKLDSPANEDVVWMALDQLKKEKLIANSEEVVSKFNGLARREVIKRVGLASLAALPLIATIVVPTAAQSLSGCIIAAMNPPGCPCGAPSDCSPGSCMSNCGAGPNTCCG